MFPKSCVRINQFREKRIKLKSGKPKGYTWKAISVTWGCLRVRKIQFRTSGHITLVLISTAPSTLSPGSGSNGGSGSISASTLKPYYKLDNGIHFHGLSRSPRKCFGYRPIQILEFTWELFSIKKGIILYFGVYRDFLFVRRRIKGIINFSFFSMETGFCVLFPAVDYVRTISLKTTTVLWDDVS